VSTRIQVAEVAADEATIYNAAAEMYNELVAGGEDPVDAAWMVDEHFGFTANGYHHRDELAADPFKPDYKKLGRERLRGGYWDAAEGPGVQ